MHFAAKGTKTGPTEGTNRKDRIERRASSASEVGACLQAIRPTEANEGNQGRTDGVI